MASPTSHSLRSKHMTKESVTQSLSDLGVEKHDLNQINNLVRGVPSKTRHIKENAFSTIVSIQGKWQRHKEKTNELLRSKNNEVKKEKDRYNKLHAEVVQLELQVDRLKNDKNNLEEKCEELTQIKVAEKRALQQKEEQARELTRAKQQLIQANDDKEKFMDKARALEKANHESIVENRGLKKELKKANSRGDHLENELKETRCELEMFEEMLRKFPAGDESTDFFSDDNIENPSSPVKDFMNNKFSTSKSSKPQANKAIAYDIAVDGENFEDFRPIVSSTPIVSTRPVKEKRSVTSTLKHLTAESQHFQQSLSGVTEEVRKMKIRDQNLSKMLEESRHE